nr:probable xyloglucan endotransglucosylase/hydrolase protein 8 [Tanacetum cinerariifolium]
KPPPGVSLKQGEVYKLGKALYGLKQAQRAWYEKFATLVTSIGFASNHHDFALFVKQSSAGGILLSLYVDDMIITRDDCVGTESLKLELAHRFAMKDLGLLRYFWGIEVASSPKGYLMSQSKYIGDLLDHAITTDKMVKDIPIDAKAKYTSTDGDPLPDPNNLFWLQQGFIGMLFCIFAGIFEKSKKQYVLSKFSTKAEYRAMTVTTSEIVWLCWLLADMGVRISRSTPLHCDNRSAIQIAPIATTCCSADSKSSFEDNFSIMWSENHFKTSEDGQIWYLSLDNDTGCGFQTKQKYRFGWFSMKLKLVGGDSAGVVTAYYMCTEDGAGPTRDELDFEFLGNRTGEPYLIQTNVYKNGTGNREMRHKLWFDPTLDYHTYSILWNSHQIIFFVDRVPVRVYKNADYENKFFPNQKPMYLFSSIWNADDWATRGGLEKTDWKKAPFVSSYKDFTVDGCQWKDPYPECVSTTTKHWWDQPRKGPRPNKEWTPKLCPTSVD